MTKISKLICCVFPMLAAMACSSSQPPIGAKIGNAGSVSDFYGIQSVSVQSTGGGWTSFGFGAVNGYPGASADIGRTGVPKRINGVWRKGWDLNEQLIYYRIDEPIDSSLAEKKMKAMHDYYKEFSTAWPVMQVVVDEDNIMLLYTFSCYSKIDNCAPKDNADPNGWVVKSPENLTDVVVLFEGIGETSLTPFE
ncbi:hypothetical protein [Vibrio mexicanus]|uniref:hypothetical protein n=1 Tax=Vibrio mexicanus TaxID=1004326 RepID=UPI00063CDE8A|nr:hypothetical protein [Vibrio mexicanus]